MSTHPTRINIKNSCNSLLCALIAIMVWSPFASADEGVNDRKIVGIGCHQVNGTCFVTLDGPAFGANEGCLNASTNQFRWDDADQPNGKRTFAALYGAYLSGKSVSVYISGCSAQSSPSLNYYIIFN